MKNFESLGISEGLIKTLKENGINEPTPIQEKTIPLLLSGRDVIAQSQTGTGKTFAFVLPILERIDPDNPNIQALIVTPTRELALQITNEIKKMINQMEGIQILAVYGGQDVESQLKKLKKNIHIVIGTPGRLLDHIRRETLDLGHASFLVLDEADQMLHIGFLDEVEAIIRETPKTRQTLLFSATMPSEIKKLARKHMDKPEYIQIEKTQAPLSTIQQIAISTVDRAKQNDLIESLHLYQPFLAVIFCRTKRRVSKLTDALKAEGFNCEELHGDLSQAKREQVMRNFRECKLQYLVATDVASRGLDVDGVTHVFNYDIPLDTESYIHRIGRTGRAGSKGLAITFYAPKDRPLLDAIEKDLGTRIDKQNMGNARKSSSQEETIEQPKKVDKNRNKRQKDRNFGAAKERKGKALITKPKTEGKKTQGSSSTSDFRNKNQNKRDFKKKNESDFIQRPGGKEERNSTNERSRNANGTQPKARKGNKISNPRSSKRN